MISLKVNGRAYGGWKRASVTRSIEAASGVFSLEVSDRWTGQEVAWPINEEDECSLWLEDQRVITGYVDKLDLSFGSEDHTIGVAGRDKVGTLIDCSAVLDQWEFKRLSVLKFAQKVAEPYGVSVTLQPFLVEPPPPAKISIDPGDSALEAIERACRLAGLLPISDGAGGLVLVRAGDDHCVTALVEGENILRGSASFDASQRHRTYLVLGQHRGSDELNGEQAASIKGFAEDQNVRRTARTLLIRPEGNVTPKQATDRAAWEASFRAAQGDTVTITVQGWTQATGVLWPVNSLVTVRSPSLRVSGDMLITETTFEVGESGTTTELTLRSPAAFSTEPVITPAASSGLWKEIAGGV